MSKHANISGADERPELFRQILPQSDADCLDETLQAMPAEDFDAAAVTGKTLAKLGLGRADAKLTVVNETPVRETPAPKRRFRFRTVLIAACCAVLLLATVAVAKIMHDKKARVIEITELKEHLTAERASAFLPLGQSGKIGDVTVTAVDMIGELPANIVRKILRMPMIKLRKSAGTEHEQFYIDAMRALFKLDTLGGTGTSEMRHHHYRHEEQ